MRITDCLDALRDAGWKAPATVCDPIKFRPTGDGDGFGDSSGFEVTSREMESVLGWALQVWYAERCAVISVGFDATYGPTIDGVRTIKTIGEIREYSIVWPHKDERGILFANLSTAPTMLEAMVAGIRTLAQRGELS